MTSGSSATLHDLWQTAENHTDKGNPSHTFFGQSYLHVYERYFEPIRSTVRNVLEIGVFGGHSLRLWRDYFPNAAIHGLDINPKVAGIDGRIAVHTGDQSNANDLAAIAACGPFDIIIDDGSHATAHILTSFESLWPHVACSGFYCMEDMRCTYRESGDEGWPGMSLNGPIPPNKRSDIDACLLNRLRAMDDFMGSVRVIHLHPMLYVFEKL